MVGEFVTENGVRLRVGRISRHIIDEFAAKNPQPEPPQMTVTIWPDIEEEVPNYDDPAYIAEYQSWQIDFGYSLFDLIVDAVEIVDSAEMSAVTEIEELKSSGLSGGDDKSALLFYVILADAEEMGNVVDLVLYNSTVTARGLMEAAEMYDVTWHGNRVPIAASPGGVGKASSIFCDRQAATAEGYKWREFCELPGPEQSAVVAFHRLNTRLNSLAMKR